MSSSKSFRHRYPQFAWLDYAAPAVSLPCLLNTLAVPLAEPGALTIEFLRLAAALSALALLTLVIVFFQMKAVSAQPPAPVSGGGGQTTRGPRLAMLLALLPVFVAIISLIMTICVHLSAVITLCLIEDRLMRSPFLSQPVYQDLFWFWMDQTLKGALFDLMEVFSLGVSEIRWEATANVWFAGVVVAWRMFVSIIVVAILLSAPKAVWRAIRREVGRRLRRGSTSAP